MAQEGRDINLQFTETGSDSTRTHVGKRMVKYDDPDSLYTIFRQG